jgi:hypothetical protein
MSSSPDEATSKPDVATPDEPAAPAATAAADAAPPEVKQAAAPAAKPDAPEPDEREPLPRNVLLYTVFSLMCIGIGLWLVLAWSGYKEKYTQQTEGWHLGSTKMLEITLIKDDKKNLACASDKSFGEVHCGYHLDGTPWGPGPDQDAHTLQPFNTIKNELFLSAGLWQAPVLRGELPKDRFTVVCNYKVVGVLKAVSLRWSQTGSFNPVDQSVAVGTLEDCVIPQ